MFDIEYPIIHDVIQKSPEWFTLRLGKFTASEIWKLMPNTKGVDHQTRTTYILETAIGRLSNDYSEIDAPSLRWGTENEPYAIELYEALNNIVVEKVGFIQFSDNAGCSPDGFVGDINISVKCPKSKKEHYYNLCLSDKSDFKKDWKEYYWQEQCNMLFASKSLTWNLETHQQTI